MFTGIIHNQGKVIKRAERGGQVRFAFRLAALEKKKLQPGESIAVNGVCLTAAKIAGAIFEADVIRETLQATTLSQLRTGDSVNLERSMKAGDLIGGHFVTGHVDEKGKIVKIEKNKKNTVFYIQASEKLRNYIAEKGSIAVDGISLTVQSVNKNTFKVGIIPFTLHHTTLGTRKAGDFVNLEADLIARYLRVLDHSLKKSPRKLVISYLKRQGF